MKNAGDALIYRTSGLIVLISSIAMIALMVTGGWEAMVAEQLTYLLADRVPS